MRSSLGRARSAAFVLALSLALAGCAHGGGGAAAARDGVRFDIAADPQTLDPLFAHVDASLVEPQLARLIFEPFFDLDERGRPVPALLREIPTLRNGGISPDARTLTYRLRKGVVWSDGVAVTAADVLFTLHALLDPANPVRSRAGYDLIDRATAPDPHTVVFHLKQPWAPAVATFFAYGTTPQFVLPAHVLRSETPLEHAPFASAPAVGDGPFVFREWHRGDRVVYVANPRYWRRRPAVPRIDVRVVPDPNTNLSLLRAGELDFNLIAPVQIQTVAGTPGVAFRDVPTALVAGLALEVRHVPLDDVRVRRALAQSIDRAAISRLITFGHYPVADSDRPRFSLAYERSVREPAFDAAAADRAFDAAGWRRTASGMRAKNGRPLELTYVQFPESTTGVRVATFVQAALRSRGVDLAVKSISNAQLFLPASGTLARGDFDLAYVPWTMGADPDDRFVFGCAGADKNYMRFCDPAIDRLETRAAAEPSEAARRLAYVAIDRIVVRDVPVIWLFNPNYTYAYRTRLAGFAPNAFTPTWNAWQWRLR